MQERKWVIRFGGNRYKKPRSVMGALLDMVRTPEYTWMDIARTIAHPFFSLQHLLSELYTVNFFTQVPRLEVPVYFLEGRHDYTVPADMAAQYYDVLDAPRGKTWVWFEESAHFPCFEEPTKFDQVMELPLCITTREAR